MSLRLTYVKSQGLGGAIWHHRNQSALVHVITCSLFSARPVTWASYQIRKNTGCACAGNAGSVSRRRRLQRKTLVSDPGMHHGTCVTHVPWCMSGSLTRCGGENDPGIPGACAPSILRVWQEPHDLMLTCSSITPLEIFISPFRLLVYGEITLACSVMFVKQSSNKYFFRSNELHSNCALIW